MPVAEVHASTIEEIEGGLATAWFGGTEEGAKDVVIWLSRNKGDGWSKPEIITCWTSIDFNACGFTA